ncbi:hypothetical protein C427_5195 [Paraglaciecola psychrophila 170]|uniref:Uncharacterized protein n=1 Tax=Paraglaciecola psychrophila 170 TaxID=1129794 RepID=K6ZI28_9ALTE|nr:hypothetical protein C427_5195 [Paraglaciecola psychrophila 170]GAC35651.1 hypothetical protein GPSY_0001 [Paraglaciecola psychrophila 170]
MDVIFTYTDNIAQDIDNPNIINFPIIPIYLSSTSFSQQIL